MDTSLPVYTPGHRTQDITRVKLGTVSSSGLPLRTSIPSLSSSSTCSKESTNTSPSTSSRSSSDSGGSRIPISKSQDDLLRNVQLRNKRPGTGSSVATKLQRPISYRNTRTSSPRNSKLMSRNSVEVLAYTESQKNNYNLNETSQRKYYSQYSNKPNKYEAASKFTKKFGSKDSSLNIYQKNSKKTLGADSRLSPTQSNSSLIPTPASQKNNKNLEKKPTQQPVKSAASLSGSTGTPTTRAGSNVGHNKLSAENKKNTRTCNNSTKSKPANKEKPVETKAPSDSLKIDDHVKTVDAKTGVSAGPPSEQRLTPMINSGGLQDKDPVKNVPTDRHSADSVEKLLSDQLMNGKLPPKAKFRADDEISIGDESCDALENCEEAENVKDAGSMTSTGKVTVTPSKYDKMTKSKDSKTPDPYPPSAASLLVARCLEEGGGRVRDQKTASLPLNSALVSFDQTDKSTSLDKYYKSDNKPQIVKTSSEGFFQRLSNLRRSFNAHDQKRSTNVKIRPHITDSNTPFFQGISHPSKRQGNNNSSARHHKSHHSIHLVLPPILQSYKTPTRKYVFQRAFPVTTKVDNKLKRSFSFSDAHVIAQCVVDNDVGVIGDLFPAFLTSDTVYNAIDRDKLNKTESSAKDNTNVKKLTKIAKVKDTNASEQTLIGTSVRDDHEDDKNDASEASKLLDGSNLTLTASIVNIHNVTGRIMSCSV